MKNPTMRSRTRKRAAALRRWTSLALAAGLAACGDVELVPIPQVAVQGAAIDGSDDPAQAQSSSPRKRTAPKRMSSTTGEPGATVDEAVAAAATEIAGAAPDAESTSSGLDAPVQATPLADDSLVGAVEGGDAAESGVIDIGASETGEAAVEAVQVEEAKPVAVVASETEPVAEQPAQKEQDGPIDLTYQDLSLIDYDVDAMLDYMLFPDEYEDEDTSFLELPADLKALDGKEISIVGYMIPGEIKKGNVRDFMLVRDLMGCCFGGVPMPDEWVDVVMDEDAEAEYRPYMPMRVTGVLTLGGEQDEAGFALGIYRLQASDVEVED